MWCEKHIQVRCEKHIQVRISSDTIAGVYVVCWKRNGEFKLVMLSCQPQGNYDDDGQLGMVHAQTQINVTQNTWEW